MQAMVQLTFKGCKVPQMMRRLQHVGQLNAEVFMFQLAFFVSSIVGSQYAVQ
jgi:hypothetical protein